MSAPSSVLSLPLLFAKDRGSLHPLALLPAVDAVIGYFMLVWLVVGGGQHCLLFSIDLNLSQKLCAPVQPSGTGLGSRMSSGSSHPTLGTEVGICCCLLQSAASVFTTVPSEYQAYCPSPGSLGERGEKVPDGLCVVPMVTAGASSRPTLTGRERSQDSHLSFCEHQFCQGNRPMITYKFLYLWLLEVIFYLTSPHSTFTI